MKRIILTSISSLAVLVTLAGCSAHCNCPTCPTMQTTPNGTTTIIHEHRHDDDE